MKPTEAEMLAAAHLCGQTPQLPADAAAAATEMRRTAQALRDWRKAFDQLPAPQMPKPSRRLDWRPMALAAALLLLAAGAAFVIIRYLSGDAGRPTIARTEGDDFSWIAQIPSAPPRPANGAATKRGGPPAGSGDAGKGGGPAGGGNTTRIPLPPGLDSAGGYSIWTIGPLSVRIPGSLDDGLAFVAGRRAGPDRVELTYRDGSRTVHVFLAKASRPDQPFAPMRIGPHDLHAATRNGLSIAFEADGPGTYDWNVLADLFVEK